MHGDQLIHLLEEGYTAIRCDCSLCMHSGLVSLPWLAEFKGIHAYWPTIRKRLVCSNCKSKHIQAEPAMKLRQYAIQLHERRNRWNEPA